MDPAVQAYVDGIAPENRPLFDRLQGLILGAYPDATVSISYGIPTYKSGKRRMYVGSWPHGLSVYGWRQGTVDGFIARHPGLRTSKGTIRLAAADAAAISDGELMELVRAALEPDA